MCVYLQITSRTELHGNLDPDSMPDPNYHADPGLAPSDSDLSIALEYPAPAMMMVKAMMMMMTKKKGSKFGSHRFGESGGNPTRQLHPRVNILIPL